MVEVNFNTICGAMIGFQIINPFEDEEEVDYYVLIDLLFVSILFTKYK